MRSLHIPTLFFTNLVACNSLSPIKTLAKKHCTNRYVNCYMNENCISDNQNDRDTSERSWREYCPIDSCVHYVESNFHDECYKVKRKYLECLADLADSELCDVDKCSEEFRNMKDADCSSSDWREG